MTNLFVAPKIKVGFQKRKDTFTGQLAYIIYYDEKGKLRKEASWESWRDKKIDPQEFDNVPTDGFTINKDVKRYNGEWWSSTRTMVRIHDPRGFEFEVTTENLIAILMHTDCLKRGLIGQFVYAWAGTELVLLPTNSEEYQHAVKFTGGLSKKVKAKELVPGISYHTKKTNEDVIYLGKMDWYHFSNKGVYWDLVGERNGHKYHIFTKDNGESFFAKSSVDFLSEANNTVPVSNYAELVDKYNSKLYAKNIKSFIFKRVDFDDSHEVSYGRVYLNRDLYWTKLPNEIFCQCYIQSKEGAVNGKYQTVGYSISYGDNYYRNEKIVGIKNNTSELLQISNPSPREKYSYYWYQGSNIEIFSLEKLKESEFYDMYAVLENGKEIKVKCLSELNEFQSQ